MPKRKTPDKHGPSRFTETTLKALAKDLQSGRLPLERTQVSDDLVTGLRAMVHKSGLVSFAISYFVGDKRPHMHLGSLNTDEEDHITVEEARHLAKIVKSLGDKGVDVQDGLHRRLIAELSRDGVNWRPPKFDKKRA